MYPCASICLVIYFVFSFLRLWQQQKQQNQQLGALANLIELHLIAIPEVTFSFMVLPGEGMQFWSAKLWAPAALCPSEGITQWFWQRLTNEPNAEKHNAISQAGLVSHLCADSDCNDRTRHITSQVIVILPHTPPLSTTSILPFPSPHHLFSGAISLTKLVLQSMVGDLNLFLRFLSSFGRNDLRNFKNADCIYVPMPNEEREHKEGTNLKNWANVTAKTERVVSKDKTVLVIWFGDLPLPPPVVRNSEGVLRFTWSRKVHGVWSTLFVALFIFLYP